MHQHRAFRLVIGLALATAVSVSPHRPVTGAAGEAAGLQFRFLGPAVGNRAAAIAGIPGDPQRVLRRRGVRRRLEDHRRRD